MDLDGRRSARRPRRRSLSPKHHHGRHVDAHPERGCCRHDRRRVPAVRQGHERRHHAVHDREPHDQRHGRHRRHGHRDAGDLASPPGRPGRSRSRPGTASRGYDAGDVSACRPGRRCRSTVERHVLRTRGPDAGEHAGRHVHGHLHGHPGRRNSSGSFQLVVTSTTPVVDGQFTISANPSTLTVAHGAVGLVTVLVTWTGGTTRRPIQFDVTGLPNGTIVTYTCKPERRGHHGEPRRAGRRHAGVLHAHGHRHGGERGHLEHPGHAHRHLTCPVQWPARAPVRDLRVVGRGPVALGTDRQYDGPSRQRHSMNSSTLSPRFWRLTATTLDVVLHQAAGLRGLPRCDQHERGRRGRVRACRRGRGDRPPPPCGGSRSARWCAA